jgi:hypothetical protein
MQLESVALALSGKTPKKKDVKKGESKTPQDWIDQRIEGVSGLTRGAILMAVSLLLSAPMALFLPASFDAPWIIIWAVFFGWMAVWGGIEVAYGLSAILESKSRLRLSRRAVNESLHEAGQQNPLLPGEPFQTSTGLNTFKPSATPTSVTEGTTRHLDEGS